MAKRQSILFRLLAWGGGFVLLIAIAIWVMILIARHRLEAYRAEHEARGEKFIIAALAPPPPPENASSNAATLVAACKDLSDKVSSKGSKLFTIGRLETVPGQAEVIHSRKMASQYLKVVPWERFIRNLEPFRPTLTKIRDAARISPMSLQLDYSKGRFGPLPIEGLRTGNYLGMESTLFLREQRPDMAVNNAIAILTIAGLLQENPLMFSQRCAISMMEVDSRVTWEILQSPASPIDLARLQAAWEAISLTQKLPDILRMERARSCEILNRPLDILGATDPSLFVAAPTYLPRSLHEAWYKTQFTTWFILYRYSDEEQCIASQQNLIDSLASHVNLQTLMSIDSAITKDVQARGATRFLSSMAASSRAGFLRSVASADSLQKLTIAAIAIQRYRLDHSGQPPESLEALVPAYLSSVPKDAMDLQPIHYSLTGGTFQLYSVGTNGTDDGGSSIPLPEARPKEIMDRQDIVWPQPAP